MIEKNDIKFYCHLNNKMIKFLLLINLLKISADIVNNQALSISRGFLAGTSLPDQGLAFFGGGKDITSAIDNVDVYNANTNQWTILHLTVPRQLLAASYYIKENLVFFAGGCSFRCDVSYDVVDIYNANTSMWTTSKLSIQRNSLAAASIGDGYVLFAGGVNNDGPQNVVDIYDCKNKSWSISYLSSKRLNIASSSISRLNLIFFGGGDDVLNVYPSVDVYNVYTKTWYLYNMTTARTQCAASSLPNLGLVFFAGGRDRYNQDLDSIEIFDVNNFVFYPAYLSQPRRSLMAAAIPSLNRVFFLGGEQYFYGFIAIFADIADYIDFNIGKQSSFKLANGIANGASALLTKQDLVIFAGGESSSNPIYVNQVNVFGGCEIGKYQSINPNQCNNCFPGYVCQFGNTNPVICPKGYYCIGNSQNNLIPCPSGSYSSSTGLKSIDECTKCPTGTYNTQNGQTSTDSCLPCYLGSICNRGSVFPKDCPSNYYCPDSSSLISCPSGTYTTTANTLESSCIPCSQGSYCPGNGQFPSPCSPGTYASKNGSSACETCPEGHFCQFASIAPIICAKDTYAGKGSAACTPCEDGQYTLGQGYSSCTTCLNGFWNIGNWWCQDTYQRLITVVIWIGSVFSVIITFFKLRLFIRRRIRKLKHYDYQPSLKNILFMESIIQQKKKYNSSLIAKIDEANVEYMYRNFDKELHGLKETIVNLKLEIDRLK